MRESISAAFHHTTVPYGDDNRQVRGVIVRCGAPGCEAAISLPVNRQHGIGADEDIEWRFIARKLEPKGWRVGKSRHAHRCPKCLNAAKFTTIRNANMSGNMNGNAMTEKLQVVKDIRQMTREDRRLIFAKLNEVYVDDKTGYGESWTDEKVATDLGVPRAWVRLVREENFGDEQGNDNIKIAVAEARALLAEIKAKLLPADELSKLLLRADKIEKQLAEIGRVMK